MAKFRYDKKKKRPLVKRILILIIAVAIFLCIIIRAIPTRAECYT